jgi:hypothetical protein
MAEAKKEDAAGPEKDKVGDSKAGEKQAEAKRQIEKMMEEGRTGEAYALSLYYSLTPPEIKKAELDKMPVSEKWNKKYAAIAAKYPPKAKPEEPKADATPKEPAKDPEKDGKDAKDPKAEKDKSPEPAKDDKDKEKKPDAPAKDKAEIKPSK